MYVNILFLSTKGRIKALACLLTMGVSVTTQCNVTKETMLHKALASLQETSPIDAAEKFRQYVFLNNFHISSYTCIINI